MNNSKTTPHGSAHHRMATETQLLAEEKWLVNALKKIAQQRNSLQIEKLQLKYLLSTLQANEPDGTAELKQEELSRDSVKPEDFQASLAELTRQKERWDREKLDDEFLCNTQELDLNVNSNLYNMPSFSQQDDFMEEYDEEEDDDVDDDESHESMLNMFLMNK